MRAPLLGLTLSLLACGGPGPATSPWSVSGTLNGYGLAQELRSAVAFRVMDGGTTYTALQFTSAPDACAFTKATACPGSARVLVLKVRGTEPGAYPVSRDSPLAPAAGKAGVTFLQLDSSCAPAASDVVGSAGSLTLTDVNLSQGGQVRFSFDGQSPPILASGTLPTCVL